MQTGQIIKACSSSFYALVLVSGVAQAKCNFFTGWADNKDGTVTDTRNGLIWKRCAEGFEFSNGVCTGEGMKATWDEAMSMAQQSRFLGQSDWRLPTRKEFEAVLGTYDECKNNQNGEYAASKAIAHMGGRAWAASGYSSNAWNVYFYDGSVVNSLRVSTYYVRLVRAGQILGGEAALEFVNEIAEKARIKAEQEAERRVLEAPNILKAMSKDEVCAAYGKALRGQEIYEIGDVAELMKLVKKESARRKLKFDDSLTRKERIRMGISECQLFASWGLPEDQNRTVGGWGVHIQHVYGSGTYVYTENGKVTSWQD